MATGDSSFAADAGPEPLAGLFEALESPLLAYARRQVPDADMAQEIVQEAFLRLHAQWAQVREPRAWLYRTVRNLALNRRRDDARLVPLDRAAPDGSAETASAADHDPADPCPLPDEQIARWEAVGLVQLAVRRLDARSRQVLELKFVHDLSYKEISARTGLSVGYVGYLLHHALKTLAAELDRAGLLP